MLRVIGAGFGRTGTMSLKRALEALGFGPCYHFTEMRRAGHTGRWLAAAGSPDDAAARDWDTLFEGYQATTDWPGAAYYATLARRYPEAKVILTIRDPNEWHASLCRTLLALRRALVSWMPGAAAIARLTDRLIWDGTFHGRAADRAHATAVFEAHREAVTAAIPSERLLIFDVRDGWEPLCAFLDVPVPTGISFPRENDSAKIRRFVWLLRAGRVLAPGAVALVVALVVSRWV